MKLIKIESIGRLAKLPVGIFGATTALAGLANALKTCHLLFGMPESWGLSMTVICWAVFTALFASYVLKWILFPEKVAAEIANPVTAHYAGTFFISVVVIGAQVTAYSLLAGRCIWLAGTIGCLFFMSRRASIMFNGNIVASDAIPAILIPGLTLLNDAQAGSAMQFGAAGYHADVFLFSIGIVYSITFFVLVEYRLIHQEPLNNFFVPSLLFMCAPFELGFQAYVSLTPHVDLFASIMFSFGLFIFVILFFHVFTKSLRFETSWWGACFSTGALANAAMKFEVLNPNPAVRVTAVIILMVLIGLIGVTAYQSLRALFFPEPRSPVIATNLRQH